MKIIKESVNSKSNKLILDESLFKSLAEDLSHYQDKVSELLSSELVDTVKETTFNDSEAFEVTTNNGKILYLVPSTLSQVDVYDNQGNVLDTNVFWRYIVDEFIQTEEAGFVYEIVGGDCAGTYTIDELKNLPCFDGRYSDDQSEIRNNGGFTHRKELDNQPELNGYLGPMFNGWDKNHNAILRYETQEVYDILSEGRTNEGILSAIGGAIGATAVNNLMGEDVELVEELGSDIPYKLYHATYKQFIDSIQQKGLGNTKRKMWSDSQKGVVYLATDPYVAESYAEESEWLDKVDDPDKYIDNIIILEIKTSILDRDKLFIDRNVILDDDEENTTWEYHGIIPWAACKVL